MRGLFLRANKRTGARRMRIAEGRMDRMLSSKSRVKSNARAHSATTGPNTSSGCCGHIDEPFIVNLDVKRGLTTECKS